MASYQANNCYPDEEDDDDLRGDEYLEIPSCVESLASSASQLRQLARHAGQYYSKLLICYGHTCESSWKNVDQPNEHSAAKPVDGPDLKEDASPQWNGPTGKTAPNEFETLVKDKISLQRLSSTNKLLPLLDELSTFVERCSASVESTVRRMTYYLNVPDKEARHVARGGPFHLTRDIRVDTIFIALMDLMFALVRLDKILTHHTNIRSNLKLFLTACKLDSSTIANEMQLPGRDDLTKLSEYISSIEVTLFGDANANDTALLEQCLNQVQHLHLILTKDKTSLGFKRLSQLFEEYLIFFAKNLAEEPSSHGKIKSIKIVTARLINMNLLSTVHMNRPSHRTFGLSCLWILYITLFKQAEKKVIKALNQAMQRSNSSKTIHLDGLNCAIPLGDFLRIHLPKSMIESRTYDNLYSKQDLSLDACAEFEHLLLRATPWLVNLHTEALDYALGRMENWPKKQVALIEEGFQISNEINSAINMIHAAHCNEKQPMSRAYLFALFRLTALLKAVAHGYNQHESFLTSCLVRVEQLVRTRWRHLLKRMQKRQISMKHSERKLDLDSLLMLMAICERPEMINSELGRDYQFICLSMLLPSMNQEELQEVNHSLDLLRVSSSDRLYEATNCNILYWYLPTLGAYYNHAIEEFPSAIDELHYIHEGLRDIWTLFEPIHRPTWSSLNIDWLCDRRSEFLRELEADLIDQFKSDFVDRICQEFEVELRLQTHRDLYHDEHNNPFRRHLYNFKQLIKQDRTAARFRIFNQTLDLNSLIEHHLNKVCYNLTAIAPHDWFTYDSMMNLARHKYNLSFVNSQLPAQTLDSGLDLLDITRNLSLFASRYSYDLTNQLFIEKCSNRTSNASSVGLNSMLSSYAASSSSSQSLNVIQPKHVAQSIQTHGYGVLDSTINCTYQTLKRLVNLFSRQIADDKLRATLQKEHQKFSAESRAQTQPAVLSFERANKIAKQFRLTAANLNDSNNTSRPAGIDLDSIRLTVTQLGNLLAFIRLIKSGALSCASKAVDFLPELDDLSNLRLGRCAESEFVDYKLQAPLFDAAKNLDQCVSDLEENFSSKTNYFKIIVSLFTSLLSSKQTQSETRLKRDESDSSVQYQEGDTANGTRQSPLDKRDHLKLFFILLPALIINYIDHLINCKERVVSRSSSARFGALLSDDGFAMGASFLLTTLGQTDDHNKLDWLSQTCAKLREDVEELVGRSRDSKYEESLRQTASMTIRRLNRLVSEYVALERTLNCALLLFSSATQEG